MEQTAAEEAADAPFSNERFYEQLMRERIVSDQSREEKYLQSF